MAVCYFLVGQIARHCKASVVCAGADCIVMESKQWDGDLRIWGDTKTIECPATIPERDFLVITGAAQCNGYFFTEYGEDE